MSNNGNGITENYKEGKYDIEVDIWGTKFWYYKGYSHREDGPAIESNLGGKEWYINGKKHRDDGPAVEGLNGHKEWWLDEISYTEKGWKIEMRKRKLELLEI